MTIIEERAKKYALQFEERYQVAMFIAYIKGVTDQKKIDDQHILFIADAHEHQKKLLIDKACEWLKSHAYHLATSDIKLNIENFRKAMKG